MKDAPEDDPTPDKPKKRPNRKKGLNPAIRREQQRIYLSDEQREGAVSTFFESVKEENNGITPAKLEVFICGPLRAAAGSLRGPLGFSH